MLKPGSNDFFLWISVIPSVSKCSHKNVKANKNWRDKLIKIVRNYCVEGWKLIS
jgi:hypothetical protein